MTVRANIIGQRFGRLIAIECLGLDRGSIRWQFRCDCGNEKAATASNVRSGKTQSCGCLRRERALQSVKAAQKSAAVSNTTHGHSATRRTALRKEYNIWLTMRQRCRNKNNHKFADYGARGITVCERWNSFENFIADMGPKPTPAHSIDRVDNDGNYEPENCRWATLAQQNENQRYSRASRWIEHDGERHTVTEWARIKGINPVTLHARLTRYRWPIGKALTA